MSAANFYDNFLSSQIGSGINDRIYRLYRKVVKIGLKKNEAILEIGCGIGALTFLLASKLKTGVIEAFDPSPKSVVFAREKVRQRNVHFFTGDAASYLPKASASFDKVLLFDVLEHIPEEAHLQVFTKIESLLTAEGLLLINLPNPGYILYDRAHQPDVLQELDQPVFLQDLLPKIIQANLELVQFETHSVWAREDYHFLIVRKKRTFREHLLSDERSFFQKAGVRLQREIRKLRYRFP
jgi:trans-aconitate 2-methyltransferase